MGSAQRACSKVKEPWSQKYSHNHFYILLTILLECLYRSSFFICRTCLYFMNNFKNQTIEPRSKQLPCGHMSYHHLSEVPEGSARSGICQVRDPHRQSSASQHCVRFSATPHTSAHIIYKHEQRKRKISWTANIRLLPLIVHMWNQMFLTCVGALYKKVPL